MRDAAPVGSQIARARDVFCIPVAIFVRRPGEPDGRRLALSEISRCRLHKSTVDTAVGRAYALTHVQRGFARRSHPAPRLAPVSGPPSLPPSARARAPVGTVYIY